MSASAAGQQPSSADPSAAALRAKQAAEALAKVERHEMQQHSMVASAAADGRLGPLQHRSSANWVKRVAKELEDAETAAAEKDEPTPARDEGAETVGSEERNATEARWDRKVMELDADNFEA